MAGNLLDAGQSLTVCNRTAAEVEPLVEAEATLAVTARDLAAGADLIISKGIFDREKKSS